MVVLSPIATSSICTRHARKDHSCHFGNNWEIGSMPTINATSTAQSFGFAPVADLPDISATDLKNKFSEVARLAAREPLAVTRHNRRDFVILTASQYEELQQSRRAPLKTLTTEFDQLVARMNTPKAKRAAASLFSASPKALGQAALKVRQATAHA
jgi:prevent-host-death family protein